MASMRAIVGVFAQRRVAAAHALALTVWLVSAGSALPAGQATAGLTIWDGVFTDAQAARGQAAFLNSCARCHNNELVGSERGPALSGDAFWQRWDNDSFDKLFTKVRDTMPQAEIDSITDDKKIDILAFVLSKNGAKAGSKELRAELPDLEAITIVRQGGAAVGVANFNLVQVVGCLTGGRDGEWALTRAGAPVVTKDETGEAAAAGSQDAPLGEQTFQLISVVAAHRAPEQAGQKVDARGLLYRSAGENLLNLTGLRSLGSRCP